MLTSLIQRIHLTFLEVKVWIQVLCVWMLLLNGESTTMFTTCMALWNPTRQEPRWKRFEATRELLLFLARHLLGMVNTLVIGQVIEFV